MGSNLSTAPRLADDALHPHRIVVLLAPMKVFHPGKNMVKRPDSLNDQMNERRLMRSIHPNQSGDNRSACTPALTHKKPVFIFQVHSIRNSPEEVEFPRDRLRSPRWDSMITTAF